MSRTCCVPTTSRRAALIRHDRHSEFTSLYRRYVANGIPSDLALACVVDAAKAQMTLPELAHDGVFTHRPDGAPEGGLLHITRASFRWPMLHDDAGDREEAGTRSASADRLWNLRRQAGS